MLLGHFGVALLGPGVEPRARLWACMLASLWADLVLPAAVLLGLERMYVDPDEHGVFPVVLEHLPWSHGLAMTLVWTAAAWLWARRSRHHRSSAWILALLVFAHWPLDALVHRGDMMLGVAAGGPRVGWALWDRPWWSVAVEGALMLIGVVAFVSRAGGRVHRGSLVAMVGLLVLSHLVFVSAPPPPADLPPLVLSGINLLMIVPIVWAFRIHERASPGARTVGG